MKYLTIAIFFLLLILLGFLIYKSVYEGLFIVEPPPYFNFGTREWWPTRNMSYDIRGDPVIPYYKVSPFYNPEFPLKYYPRYYTYDYDGYYNYYIPGLYPPVFDPKYSVPFAVNNNKNSDSKTYSKYR